MNPGRTAGDGGFGEESDYVGLLVASHAAVALADARRLHQSRDAVTTRDLIGQAKGILMERYGVTEAQALILLVPVSTETTTRLLVVAEELANTGSLPIRRTGRR